MTELRFGHVPRRNADFVATIGIGDAALVNSICDGFFYVFSISAQETLPVNGTFVPSILPTIDDQECHRQSLRLADPQKPLRQQTHLFLGVTVFGHSTNKIVVFGFVFL